MNLMKIQIFRRIVDEILVYIYLEKKFCEEILQPNFKISIIVETMLWEEYIKIKEKIFKCSI